MERRPFSWYDAQERVKRLGSVDKAWDRYYRNFYSRATFRAWMKSGLV